MTRCAKDLQLTIYFSVLSVTCVERMTPHVKCGAKPGLVASPDTAGELEDHKDKHDAN